ncbi:MAG: GNAT family N-acetyltransferase [Gemmataceae bacterium]|nr:GNAT family N-acetyltransferase [Gemmataceae bacterium]
MSRDEAIEYWERVFAEVDFGRRLLLVAIQGEDLLGAIQLSLAQLPNGRHRGEVEKLLVHTSARRCGLGTALMMAAEDAALSRGRYLLLLDTRAGDPAGKLYEKLGYIRAGVIPGYALSPSGHPHGSAIYYRDLRDCDPQMLGENDAPTRDFP